LSKPDTERWLVSEAEPLLYVDGKKYAVKHASLYPSDYHQYTSHKQLLYTISIFPCCGFFLDNISEIQNFAANIP
jgi:hypothetical protein